MIIVLKKRPTSIVYTETGNVLSNSQSRWARWGRGGREIAMVSVFLRGICVENFENSPNLVGKLLFFINLLIMHRSVN